MNIEMRNDSNAPEKKISCSGACSCIQLEEKEDEYIISMCTSGMKRSDLDISIENNMLIISSKNDTSHIDKVIHSDNHIEYEMHQFKRSFALPSDADGNSAHATLENKKLIVHFPKHDNPYRPALLKIAVS